MSSKNGETTRCAVLVGPYQSGKTSLMEAMLAAMGSIERKGSSKDGSTVGDSSEEARKRQSGTELAVAGGHYLDDNWVLIDTPGSVEFCQDTRNACMVADVAVVVVEPEMAKIVAVSPVLKFLDTHDIPHVIVVNKMDQAAERVRDLLAGLQDVSERPLILRQVPIRNGDLITGYVDLVSERAYKYEPGGPSALIELPTDMAEREAEARGQMLEALADFDDTLLEQLLEEIEPEKSDVYDQLAAQLKTDRLVPVMLAAGEADNGVQRLLKALRHEAPTHADTAERLGLSGDGEAVGQVFKTVHAAHMGKLSLTRVWRGAVKDGETLNGVKVSGINRMMGAKLEKVSSAKAGDVVAFGRMEEIQTGDVLTPSGAAVSEGALIWPEVAAPVYALAITAENRNDEVKLSGALQKLAEEDPSLSIDHNADMGELILWGQGDTHLKVMIERLANRFKLAVQGHRPRVAYKETIKKSTDQHARHKKQSGGHGQFADIRVKIGPLQRGEGFRFTDSVVGGSVPRNYIPAVEEGAKDYLKRGPLGFPVVDVSMELYDGQSHSVDSSDMAFKIAARMAMQEGLSACHPILLEPILHVSISSPSESTSRMQRLLTGRRGQILGFDSKEGWAGWDVVEGYIPEAEVQDLIIEIRSATMGVGFYEWRFDHLSELTGRLADEVVETREAELAN